MDFAGCGGEDEKAFGKSAKAEASVFGAMFTMVDGRGDDGDSVACFENIEFYNGGLSG